MTTYRLSSPDPRDEEYLYEGRSRAAALTIARRVLGVNRIVYGEHASWGASAIPARSEQHSVWLHASRAEGCASLKLDWTVG